MEKWEIEELLVMVLKAAWYEKTAREYKKSQDEWKNWTFKKLS